MGPGAVPLDVDAIVAEAVAPERGVVFGARDSLCRARRRMLRRLQSVTRSATMAGSVFGSDKIILEFVGQPSPQGR